MPEYRVALLPSAVACLASFLIGCGDATATGGLNAAITHIEIRPRDTAVTLGSSVTVSVVALDEAGHVLPAKPELHVTGPARIEADGSVTGVGYGRAVLQATLGAFHDAGSVVVVPSGRLAGLNGSLPFFAFVMNTDGSGLKLQLRDAGWSSRVLWSRDHARLLLSSGASNGGPFRIVEIAASDGTLRTVWTPTIASNQTWPSYSPDGSWVYFVQVLGDATSKFTYGDGGVGAVWRVHPDGSSAQEIVPPPTETTQGWRSPTASPDGTRLAYLVNDGDLIVRDLATGATQTVSGLNAHMVEWSPTENRLLTAGSNGVWVMMADGNDRRQLGAYTPGADVHASWSPDGKWIVCQNGYGIDLVQLDPLLTVRLPFMITSFALAWTTAP
jgi:WD40 repeat protein